ncbi:hypothetical protein [Streptomyces scopuliridis]|uniref:hypothetical protein n=1 Tax=Streptomyces scopuliridis TaxID=452529 RepID=UPI003683A4DD
MPSNPSAIEAAKDLKVAMAEAGMPSNPSAIEAAKDLKVAMAEAGMLSDPTAMTDAQIDTIAQLAQQTHSANQAEGSDLVDTILRARI